MPILSKTLCARVSGFFVLWLGVTFLADRIAGFSQTTPFSTSLQTLFALERKRTYLGEGAALSPDGGLLAYLGTDKHLYVRDLNRNELHLVLAAAKPSETVGTLDVFSNPAFSPDGTRVLVTASGGTYYYPSDIYSLQADGSGLKQLTQGVAIPEGAPRAEEAGQAVYSQYFSRPQFSPDGTKILLHVHDVTQGTNRVAVMNPDGSELQILAPGTPLFWSADSQAVYYSQAGSVNKLFLNATQSQAISGLDGAILGKVPDKEWLVVDTGRSINVVSVQTGSAALVATWNVARVKLVTGEPAILRGVQWSKSGRVLLVYEGDTMERLEVAQPSSS